MSCLSALSRCCLCKKGDQELSYYSLDRKSQVGRTAQGICKKGKNVIVYFRYVSLHLVTLNRFTVRLECTTAFCNRLFSTNYYTKSHYLLKFFTLNLKVYGVLADGFKFPELLLRKPMTFGCVINCFSDCSKNFIAQKKHDECALKLSCALFFFQTVQNYLFVQINNVLGTV